MSEVISYMPIYDDDQCPRVATRRRWDAVFSTATKSETVPVRLCHVHEAAYRVANPPHTLRTPSVPT